MWLDFDKLANEYGLEMNKFGQEFQNHFFPKT